MKSTSIAAALALAGTVLAAPGAAQDLRHFGQADGWQVKAIGNDACVVMKYLGGSEDSTLVFYRLEPGEEPEISFSVPRRQSTPDPDRVNWDRLEPVSVQYTLSSGQTFATDGDLGLEYVNARTVRRIVGIDADTATVDRIAGSERISLRAGDERIGDLALGRAARAIDIGRRCARTLG